MAYQVDCSQGTVSRSSPRDEQEVVEHVKEHAKEKHEMDLSDDEARDMIQ